LPVNLPYQPLKWNAITMYVDPKTHTMATLYGNDAAIEGAQMRRAITLGGPKYPPGSVLALVTWTQRDDPHWFGGRIPDKPLSVEFVQVTATGQTNIYRRFAGTGLVEDHPTAGTAAQRASFVLRLTPSRLP
jgi:hypothetical protein